MTLWHLAVKKNNGDRYSLENFKYIMPPEGRYWADPFLWGDWVFFEDYDYKKGIISCGRLDENLDLVDVKPCLETEYHLSFPFLFEFEGKLYMIPETINANRVDIYECVEFPYKWQFKKNIIKECSMPDTTIHHDGEKWWLFTTNGNDDKLWLMSAKNPLGDWTLELEKKFDSSRGAGNVFQEQEFLLRPVQYSKPRYGSKIWFKSIRLYPYEEFPLSLYMSPPPGYNGLHTFNFNEKYIIIDLRKEI